MSELRRVAKELLPPSLVRAVRRRRSSVQFEGPFESWSKAKALSSGYSDASILDAVLDSALKVKAGYGSFERDSVLFKREEYVWPTLSGLLWAAARHDGQLRVLDYGGSLGSTYFQHRAFLDVLPEVRWNVVEQPHFVEAGRSHLEDPSLRFYGSIEACLNESKPNAILLSSVLQYLEDPERLIRDLTSVEADVLIVDRTPFTRDGGSLVCVQRVSEEIYPASYPMRVFDRRRFDTVVCESWRLVVRFVSPVDSPHYRVGVHGLSYEGSIYESTTVETSAVANSSPHGVEG